MGRRLRVRLPGAPFHITARLQGGEPLFEGIEDRVLELILRSAREERTTVVAYAIMPNHLHLLVVQGRRPLSSLMQPLLRRTALLVQRHYGRRGHIFERRYRDHVCLDPRYARNIVAYIHLNPVRAGLCRDASEYAWTSHRLWCGDTEHRGTQVGAATASFLRLFAAEPGESLSACRASYERFIRWRASIDHPTAEAGVLGPERPETWAGDARWHQEYGDVTWQARMSMYEQRGLPERQDLEDIAKTAIRDAAPGLPLDDLRQNVKTPLLVGIRRDVILRATAAGYANQQIARYLRVTAATVSRVRMAAVGAGMAKPVE